jgi:hypothetical protein
MGIFAQKWDNLKNNINTMNASSIGRPAWDQAGHCAVNTPGREFSHQKLSHNHTFQIPNFCLYVA